MHLLKRASCIALFASVGFLITDARADVKCASVFTDHMVLQREAPVPVWGTADAGEEVSVKVGTQNKSTKTDAGGKWKVTLDALALGEPVVVQVTGKNTVRFEDVLVGDVWVCSGQSNMGFHLKQADNADKEIAAANYPKIRLFEVKHVISDKPLTSVSGKWTACTPTSVPEFSAVGYFFGRYVHEKIGVPVGLIHTSWGGTPAEAWTDQATLESDPDFAPILGRLKDYPTDYPRQMARYEAALAKSKALPADAKKPVLRKPYPPGENPYLATVLYNGMVAPLQPYAIKGVIWYQGEANAGRAAQYRKLLPAMIEDWRRTWESPVGSSLLGSVPAVVTDAKTAAPAAKPFPFLIVQLANYSANKPDGSSPWAELREAQWLAAHKVPNCGISCTIDIGNPENVHPTNKQEVGRRLGLVAEKLVYGHDVEDSGPTYSAMSVEGNKVRVKFDHLGGGLEARGGKIEGFALAGEDQKFASADATIDGDTVVLSSANIAHPVAVRYGWANSPTCTLYSKANLPAPPFRTDDWPMVTANVK